VYRREATIKLVFSITCGAPIY